MTDTHQAYISIALDGTGALEAVAFGVSKRGGTSGIRLFTYLYAFFLGVGCIVGNDPLILSGTPVRCLPNFAYANADHCSSWLT